MSTQLAGGATTNLDALAVAGATSIGGALTLGSAAQAVPSGSAPLFNIRAWCIFDGTLSGTNAPTAGGNVANVTRNAAGDYTINFTTAMPSANYAVVGMASQASGNAALVISKDSATAYTTAAARISASQGASRADTSPITIMFIA